jgi:thermitase
MARARAYIVLTVLAATTLAGFPVRALEQPTETLVGFDPGVPLIVRAQSHLRAGATLLRPLDGLGVDLVLARSGAYAGDPAVRFAEPNARGALAIATPNDPQWGQASAWRLRRVNALGAWSVYPGKYSTASSRTSAAIKVAVLDGVIDRTHPDFIPAGGTSTDMARGGQLAIAHAKDIVPASRQTGSMDWHGTFIAGIIGAAANNGRDVTGAAYPAQVIPITVADGSGVATVADVASGISWAVGKRAKVINIALAIPSASATLERAIVNAGTAGLVVVSAAGNNGGTTRMYPAAYAAKYKHVLAVAATNELDAPAACSNRNSYMTVAAPGTNVVSLKKGGGVTSAACGTSASTALVSSAAALIAGRYPGISPASIRDRIVRGADDVAATGKDIYTGYGRLNLARALSVAGAPAVTVPRPAVAGVRTSIAFSATGSSSRGIKHMEYFVDNLVSAGKGRAMRPKDGRFDERSEIGTATIDTRSLSEGVHELHVRARDGLGVWSAPTKTVLIVDRTAPVVQNAEVDPALVVPHDDSTRVTFQIVEGLSRTVKVTITMVDAQGVTQARWIYTVPPAAYSARWQGTKDAPGSTTFNKAPLPPGPYTVTMSAVDEGGRTGSAQTSCVIAPASPA